MTNEELFKLKYPVGMFSDPGNVTFDQIQIYISEIEQLPPLIEAEYNKAVDSSRLEKVYRPNGWSARQVIHHLSDSHMNALIRFKLTMTEDHPTIKPYIEGRWAELSDVKDLDPKVSVDLLNGIHQKLIAVMKNASQSDFDRAYFHPESQKEFKLATATALYAWHGKHHLGHLRIINR